MNDKPLLKLIIPFICGILIALYFDWIKQIPLFLTIVLMAMIIPFTFYQYKHPLFRNTFLYNMLLALLVFFLGITCVKIDIIEQQNNSLEPCAGKKIWVEASLDEMPLEGKNSIKSVVNLLRYKDSTDWHPAKGKFMLFLEKDSLSQSLNYHDKLLLYITLSEIQPPKNPYQFNYRRYLTNKKIHYMSYSPSGQWAKVESSKKVTLFSMAYALRKRMLSVIESGNLAQKEQSLAAALLLGWDEKVDAATLQSFSTAGVSHLLCVSGLHVGIIFMLIGYSLFFLERTKKSRKLKSILQLLLIWFFAMIAGFAPSVVRASTMLTLVTFSRLLNRKSNVYNNVAGAAWILLLINPFYILDVGFQLSFSAVLGIVSIQPFLAKLGRTKYKSVNYVWELACVSIAAQLATLPFTLYYFHQFPVHFLIANVLIIPFAGFILGTALFLILFSSVPVLNWILEYLFSLQVLFISRIVEFIEKMPYALISGIHFDFIQSILVTIIIFGFSWAIINRQKKILYFSFGFLIVFFVYSEFDYSVHKKQKQWIVYNINDKNWGIEFVTGNKSRFYADNLVLSDTSAVKFSTENFRNRKRINQSIASVLHYSLSDANHQELFKKGNFFKFYDDRILIYNQETAEKKSNTKIRLDYVIFSENPKVKVQDILTQFDFSMLIFDASNSNYRIKNWINECDSLSITYHDVKSAGAFVKEIK